MRVEREVGERSEREREEEIEDSQMLCRRKSSTLKVLQLKWELLAH